MLKERRRQEKVMLIETVFYNEIKNLPEDVKEKFNEKKKSAFNSRRLSF